MQLYLPKIQYMYAQTTHCNNGLSADLKNFHYGWRLLTQKHCGADVPEFLTAAKASAKVTASPPEMRG